MGWVVMGSIGWVGVNKLSFRRSSTLWCGGCPQLLVLLFEKVVRPVFLGFW